MNSIAEMEKALAIFIEGESPIEIRTFVEEVVHVGVFDSIGAAASEAARLDGKATGIYFVLNPLRSEVFTRARVKNRLVPHMKGAHDVDVVRRRWLPVDLDPVRSPRTNSTDDELAAAIVRADAVWLYMRSTGFPEPIPGLSGNGVHLVFRIDALADDQGIVSGILRDLDRRFSDDIVKVDPSVSNPSRIWKLPGTLACKGPNSTGRPCRRSMLLVPKTAEMKWKRTA